MDKLYIKATELLNKHNVITYEDIIQDLVALLKEHEKETIIACADSVNNIGAIIFDSLEEANLINDTILKTELK